MIRVTWDNELLNIRRVVIHKDLPQRLERSILALVQRLGLSLACANTNPQPGDFWLGCSPDTGWGDADPSAIGWVSPFEIEDGINALELVIDHAVVLAS